MSDTVTAKASVPQSSFPYRFLMRLGLLLIYLVGLGVAAYVVYYRVREEVAGSEILPDFTISRPPESQSPNVERPEGASLPIWTGTERITVLILGIDQRGQEEDFWRSDTIILATLDPVTMKAGVLSIPRDLWVPIPGHRENRINTAHFLGDAYGYPGGGPALAVETVAYNLGVDITYFVRINFDAFVDMVDMIGGIEVDVPEPIHDHCYPTPDYGCEELFIDAGVHHFYGDMALKYARVRRTSGGDFDRARRQQQVIRAVLKRVTEARMLPQLAGLSQEMWQMLGDSVKLDPKLQLEEIIALANLGVAVDPDDITFRVIDERTTLPAETPDDMQILVPLREKIREVRDEVFGLTFEAGKLQTLEEEGATIVVMNGTQTAGLAYAAAQYLEAHGVAVIDYTNADRQDYEASMVILNRDKPTTAQHLLSLLYLPESAVIHGANPTADYDVVVLLGEDYVATQDFGE